MVNQVRGWQERQIEDDYAKLVIYRAFVEGELEAPKFLARKVPIVTSILLRMSFRLVKRWTPLSGPLGGISKVDSVVLVAASQGNSERG